uniref:Wsv035-like protein n=1 Tax=Penaeus monodon majanivirus B TaxID=2984272 RepID=A0A9C7BPN8_9VIRU|nr:MAG: wsv035-like protein [Penaeus monodon majanivirus B]
MDRVWKNNNSLFVVILFLIVAIYVGITTYLLNAYIQAHINDAVNLKCLYGEFSSRLADGVTPQKMFSEYIKDSDALLSHTIDAYALPPHPGLLLESEHGNPLQLYSQGHKRKPLPLDSVQHETLRYDQAGEEFRYATNDSDEPNTASIAIIKKYVAALLHTPSDNIANVTSDYLDTGQSINTSRDRDLHRLLFSNDVQFTPLYKNPTAVHHGGHCTNPIPFDGNKVSNCSELCMNPESRLIDGPFISGDRFYPGGQSYCWSGPPAATADRVSLSGKHRHKDRLLCSTTTSVLVLRDDGHWTCRPQYPFLFGGISGMERRACLYDPYVHEPPSAQLGSDPAEIFNLSTHLVDSVSGQTVRSHSDLTSTEYFSKMINASSSTDFLSMANDKEFYRKHFIGCDCSLTALDVFGNRPLTVKQSSNFIFFGLNSCNTNPCVMTRIADDFVHFDETDNTCHAIAQGEDQAYHIIHGDKRTPLVGTLTPAAGIVPAFSVALSNDGVTHPVKLSIGPEEANPANPTESLAVQITRLASPVIPATNNDSSNKTRNVMYVPIQSITMSGSQPKNTVRISEVYDTDAGCTPPISIGAMKNSSPTPFNVAPYFVEPIPNILAGAIPEKPYEHELLVLEGLRNSRLVSGNILGGSEMLFSLLLADNGRAKVHKSRNMLVVHSAGYKRLQRMRQFYDKVFPNRRLSTFELYQKNVTSAVNHFSSWDLKFREGEVQNFSGIENLDDTFVIREGLLLRSYRAYAGWVLNASSKAEVDFSELYYGNSGSSSSSNSSSSSSSRMNLNNAQFLFPTSHSLLPRMTSEYDIFSADREVLFDHETFSRYFTRSINFSLKIFDDSSPEYSVSPYPVGSKHGWGVNTFRYLYDFKNNIYTESDRRLRFDESDWSFEGKVLPASIFKKSLIEWGHEHGHIDDDWLREGTDTVVEYKGLLKKTGIVSRPMWWTAVWPRTFWRYSSDYFDV